MFIWAFLAVLVTHVFLASAQDTSFGYDPSANRILQTNENIAPPVILGQPQLQVVMPGHVASFSVLLADTLNVTYQWYFDGSPLTNANTDTLLINNASNVNQGVYYVVLANGTTPVTSLPAALYIDTRGCGMPDSWQMAYFGNTNQNATGDFDGDGVDNLQEFLDGTNPTNAASALYRLTLLNDGGTVTVVPNQATYTNGQMVTLTATSSGAAPFHGWTGDVVTHSNAITLTMNRNQSVFARFTPILFTWTNTVSGDWNVAANWLPGMVPGTNDSGQVLNSGTITLNSNADLGDFTFGDANNSPVLTGTGILTIHGTGAWVAGTMSGAGTTAIAPGASFMVTNSLPISLTARTLDNAGTNLWFAGTLNFNSGLITNEAGALFLVQGTVAFNNPGSSPRFDNAGVFGTSTNAGTAAFNSVSFNNYNDTQIQGGMLLLNGGGLNNGTMEVAAGATLNLAGVGAAFSASLGSSITGAGNFTVSSATATLSGLLNVSGTNTFSGDTAELNGDYICTNNVLVISGGVPSFDGTGLITPAVVNLSSGTLGGSNIVTVLNAMNWTGGAMNGTGETVIGPGATLAATDPSAVSITARTLDNEGTVTWSGGNLNITGAVITNEAGALFQIQGTVIFNAFNARFDNAGIFSTLTNAGTTTFSSITFNNYHDTQVQGGTLLLNDGGLNNGTMEISGGATLNLSSFGNSFNASPGSSITGAGNFTVGSGAATLSGLLNVGGTNTFSGGTAELNGDYVCTNNVLAISGGFPSFDGTGLVAPAVLNLSGGTLGGSDTVTVLNAMNWTGGGMNGTGQTVIRPGATLTATSSSAVSITSRTLDNGGTTLWSGGNLNISGGVITNEAGALFQLQSFITFNAFNARFDNAGVFSTPAGSGTTTFSSINFNNYHDTQVQGGVLLLNNGGLNNGTMEVAAGATLNLGGFGAAFTAAPGSSITGAGNFTVSSAAATLSGLLNVSSTNTFSGGTAELNGNYICTNNVLAISGASASFDGPGLVAPAVVNLSGGTLGGSNTVTVRNAMSWTAGSMNGTGRTVVAPGATLTVTNPATLSVTARTLDNGGTTLWAGANMNIAGGIITNEAGALFLLQSSPAFNNVGGSPRFDNVGTFRKSVSTGTANIGLSLTNYGTVDIESGILAASGGYGSSSNAVLNCAIGGTAAGTGYGQLQVAGTAPLQGGLSVNFINGFSPATNNSFTVLIAGALNGSFANFSYPSNQATMQSTNTASAVIVSVSAVVPPSPLLSASLLNSNVLLTWTAVSNVTYRLEFNPGLTGSNWNAIPGDVTSLSNLASKLDVLTSSNRFYRVYVLP